MAGTNGAATEDSIGDFLVNNLKAQDQNQEPSGGSGQPAASEDLTSRFKQSFEPLQKEGNVEGINKLRAEVESAMKSGKKVDPEFVSQLELSVESPEQKQIRELTAKKDAIANDLKLSEKEKAEALKKLEEATAPPAPYWSDPNSLENPIGIEVSGQDQSQEQFQQVDVASLQVKAKALEDLQSDPFIKSYLSAKTSGKAPAEFLHEITTGNPANMSEDQLIDSHIKNSNLTEDEAVEELAAIKAMPPSSRKEFINKERSRLMREYEKGFSKYAESNAAEADRITSVAKQSIKEAGDYLAKLKDKEVWGITYDSTQIQKLSDFANDFMQNGLFRKDGSIDVPRIMRIGMLELNKQHILQKAYERGKTEMQEEYFRTQARPSANSGLGRVADQGLINQAKQKEKEANDQWRKDNNIG